MRCHVHEGIVLSFIIKRGNNIIIAAKHFETGYICDVSTCAVYILKSLSGRKTIFCTFRDHFMCTFNYTVCTLLWIVQQCVQFEQCVQSCESFSYAFNDIFLKSPGDDKRQLILLLIL